MLGFLKLNQGETIMDIHEVIEQDVKAAYLAFKDDNFRDMNIFANRIMSNAVLSTDYRFTLVGFFLKEMARIYGPIKARKELSAFSTAKSLGDVYIKSINLEKSFNDLWEEYNQFYYRLGEHRLDEYEKGSYKKNVEFTRFAFRWLIEKLSGDRNIFFNENNHFVNGVLNEMDRIIRVHGGELIDLYAWSLVRALQLYYDYVDYFGKDERKQIIEKSVFSYIDNITKALLKDTVDPNEVTNLLQRIIVDWRICFMHFMERAELVPIEGEKKVQITEETKKKISETVTKALEEEVK
jgi:hypothetical protein